ncbi:SH3 domain-containing protein [Streptomyces sp. NPDC048275]|uniref:SH3 domain-containing protein n=1 Tax=Streptomyces sp. NPDC048275 TaxID=3155629 RepID=UPI0033C2B4F9
MRTNPTLRTLAAALLTGAVVTAVTAGTSTAAAPPAHISGNPAHISANGGSNNPVWGIIRSGGVLNVRQLPTANSSVVYRLSPGSLDLVECAVRGDSVFGISTWYWLVGARGWVSAAFVDTYGRGVHGCSNLGFGFF